MSSYTKMHFKNLDAPRFLAFLSIFSTHIIFTRSADIRSSSLFQFYNNHISNGFIGLDFYIVLSGFLISWVILEEYQFTSHFDLPYFWLKRCLRIWPVYFLLIIISGIMVWAANHVMHQQANDLPPLAWLLTFTLNFYIIKHQQAFLFFLVFFWVISAEEQCYILWGLVLKWARKAFVPISVFLIMLSLASRFYFIHDLSNLQFNTLSWVGDFAIGALLAYFAIKNGSAFQRLASIPKWVIASIYILFVAHVVFYKQLYQSDIMTTFERLIGSFFSVFIIFEQALCKNHLFELGKFKSIDYLGRISYGLICYEGLVILLYEKSTQSIVGIDSPFAVFIISPLIIFVLTVALSALSYKYFEKPIMALRYRYKIA